MSDNHEKGQQRKPFIDAEIIVEIFEKKVLKILLFILLPN